MGNGDQFWAGAQRNRAPCPSQDFGTSRFAIASVTPRQAAAAPCLSPLSGRRRTEWLRAKNPECNREAPMRRRKILGMIVSAGVGAAALAGTANAQTSPAGSAIDA